MANSHDLKTDAKIVTLRRFWCYKEQAIISPVDLLVASKLEHTRYF